MTGHANDSRPPVAVISGMGPGLGDALANVLRDGGYRVVGLSRDTHLPDQPGDSYIHMRCDVTDGLAMVESIDAISREFGPPALCIHNAMELLIRPFAETGPEDFERLWRVICLGAVNLSRAVLPGMRQRRDGCLILSGATAGVRGGARFAAFASAKFALRGLAQSLAREYGPSGIHVAHTLIDGLIWSPQTRRRFDGVLEPDCLDAYDVAASYLHLAEQPPSAWTHELDLRPASERW